MLHISYTAAREKIRYLKLVLYICCTVPPYIQNFLHVNFQMAGKIIFVYTFFQSCDF